jgi:hypothetical protein
MQPNTREPARDSQQASELHSPLKRKKSRSDNLSAGPDESSQTAKASKKPKLATPESVISFSKQTVSEKAATLKGLPKEQASLQCIISGAGPSVEEIECSHVIPKSTPRDDVSWSFLLTDYVTVLTPMKTASTAGLLLGYRH